MVEKRPERSTSSPPSGRSSAAVLAAQAATQAVEAANAAATAAAYAAAAEAARGSEEPSVSTSSASVPWPPTPSGLGMRFWYARGYPGLEDGIYIALALRNRGVDPDAPIAEGLLVGWKTADPTLRRAQASGVEQTTVFWR